MLVRSHSSRPNVVVAAAPGRYPRRDGAIVAIQRRCSAVWGIAVPRPRRQRATRQGYLMSSPPSGLRHRGIQMSPRQSTGIPDRAIRSSATPRAATLRGITPHRPGHSRAHLPRGSDPPWNGCRSVSPKRAVTRWLPSDHAGGAVPGVASVPTSMPLSVSGLFFGACHRVVPRHPSAPRCAAADDVGIAGHAAAAAGLDGAVSAGFDGASIHLDAGGDWRLKV